MATASDAELILRLYELRREERMRAARNWVLHDFNPGTLDELLVVQRDFGSQHNQYWRQVIGYWEMASSFVLRGALNRELFADCGGENIYLVAKFGRFHEEYSRIVPGGFMAQTVAVVEGQPKTAARCSQLRDYLEAQRISRVTI